MMTAAFNAQYSYNFSWPDRPMIQYSQDIVAMQEVLDPIHPESVFS
jgi:cephalosporin hydroxylase